jgi:hypothetical protein
MLSSSAERLGRCALAGRIREAGRLLPVHGQQTSEFARWNRASEKPALGKNGLVRNRKIAGLLFRFDPFHDDLQVERCRQSENLRKDGDSDRFGSDRLSEGSVDFDGIDGKIVQIGQA